MDRFFDLLGKAIGCFLGGGLVLLLTMGIAVQVSEYFRKRRGPSGVARAAAILGFRGAPDSRGAVDGTWRGNRIELAPEDEGRCHLRIEVGLPYRFEARRDGWFPSWQEPFTSGDPAFDAAFKMGGEEEAEALAILDDETRRAMLAVRTQDLRIDGGRLILRDLRLPPAETAEDFIGRVAEACALADRLRVRPRGPEALLAGFRSSGERGVRTRCLECLVGRHPDAPETHEAVRETAATDDAQVQLLASWGAPGALAQRLVELSPAQAAAELRRLPTRVRRALLARSETVPCEPAILAFLADEGVRDLGTRKAVIAILAKCGGPHAIEPLRVIAADERSRANGEPSDDDAGPVAEAAEVAILDIRSRIPSSAVSGSVSISDPSSAGALSALPQPGDVSLPARPRKH